MLVTVWVLEERPHNIGSWKPALEGQNKAIMAWPEEHQHRGAGVARACSRKDRPLRVARYVRVDENPEDCEEE